MAQHVNNICNLSNIDGEKVKFITTDNFGVTQALKNTGDIVLFRDNDRHDIYVAGEHIAGGYGVDNEGTLDTLNTVAISYYTYLQYIKENYDTIKKVVDENTETEEEQQEGGVTLLGGNSNTITPELNISNVSFALSSQDNVIKTDPLIVKAGCGIGFNSISFDIEANCNIAYLDIYSKNNFDNIREYRDGSRIYTKNYTYYVIDTLDVTSFTLDSSNYNHTEQDSSNVNELVLCENGSTEHYTDNILLAVKDETKPQSPGFPQEFLSEVVYWQLPYLYGSHEITAENFNEYDNTGIGGFDRLIYRDDCSVDTMIETEISIKFNKYFASRSHGYFACPQQWGEPKFIHKQSNLTHYWEKITTNPIQCIVNGVFVNYNVYRTKIEYYNEDPIIWIVSHKED